MALIFGFYCEMGVAGLWLGYTVASIILDIGFYVIIYHCDWYKIAQDM